jgi:hypothetical protein
MKLSVKEVANLFLLPTGEEELARNQRTSSKVCSRTGLDNTSKRWVKRSFGINVSASSSSEEEKKAKVLHITRGTH